MGKGQRSFQNVSASQPSLSFLSHKRHVIASRAKCGSCPASTASPSQEAASAYYLKALEELRVCRLRAVTPTQGRAQGQEEWKKTELLPEDKEKQSELL